MIKFIDVGFQTPRDGLRLDVEGSAIHDILYTNVISNPDCSCPTQTKGKCERHAYMNTNTNAAAVAWMSNDPQSLASYTRM